MVSVVDFRPWAQGAHPVPADLRQTTTMTRTLTIVGVVLLATPLPQPKIGSCPFGYRESGGYCTPVSNHTRPAVPRIKGKQCPSGWMQSGAYCLQMR